MYPYPVFFGIDLYTIFLCLAIISAFSVFRIYSDKMKMNWKVQNLIIISGLVSVVIGYLSAVLFQALYDIKERGAFIVDKNTGATFYGGLIGGVACFLALYFCVGHFMFPKDPIHIKFFFPFADIAAASITIAHGLGRIGCLMAGCCHGKITDTWYSVYMPAISAKAVPIQLYEAIFLFILFGLFTFRFYKHKSYGLPLYMALYGMWRFVIEYFRTDDRGNTFVEFLSPSQLIAILMILGSAVLFAVQYKVMKKYKSEENDLKTEDASVG